jgi:hypothetical protein
MTTKTLIETNPYLKNAAMRDKLISRSVRSSCGVEGIKASKLVGHIEIVRRKDKKIYKTTKA